MVIIQVAKGTLEHERCCVLDMESVERTVREIVLPEKNVRIEAISHLKYPPSQLCPAMPTVKKKWVVYPYFKAVRGRQVRTIAKLVIDQGSLHLNRGGKLTK